MHHLFPPLAFLMDACLDLFDEDVQREVASPFMTQVMAAMFMVLTIMVMVMVMGVQSFLDRGDKVNVKYVQSSSESVDR